MKFIVVLLCVFSVVLSAPPRQTLVKIDLYSSPSSRAGVTVHHSGPEQSTNVQISHKQEHRGNDGLTGHVHITHDDRERKQERTEINLSGVGHSGTDGGSGTQGKIVAYGTGISVPRQITGNLSLF